MPNSLTHQPNGSSVSKSENLNAFVHLCYHTMYCYAKCSICAMGFENSLINSLKISISIFGWFKAAYRYLCSDCSHFAVSSNRKINYTCCQSLWLQLNYLLANNMNHFTLAGHLLSFAKPNHFQSFKVIEPDRLLSIYWGKMHILNNSSNILYRISCKWFDTLSSPNQLELELTMRLFFNTFLHRSFNFYSFMIFKCIFHHTINCERWLDKSMYIFGCDCLSITIATVQCRNVNIDILISLILRDILTFLRRKNRERLLENEYLWSCWNIFDSLNHMTKLILLDTRKLWYVINHHHAHNTRHSCDWLNWLLR